MSIHRGIIWKMVISWEFIAALKGSEWGFHGVQCDDYLHFADLGISPSTNFNSVGYNVKYLPNQLDLRIHPPLHSDTHSFDTLGVHDET